MTFQDVQTAALQLSETRRAELAQRLLHSLEARHEADVEERLRGTLDYFIRAAGHSMLIVEAKNGDLTRGFAQLAVELVALDRWADDSPDPHLYGAVSVGDVWKFGFLHRAERRLTEDLNTYSVPAHVEDVVETLVAILAA